MTEGCVEPRRRGRRPGRSRRRSSGPARSRSPPRRGPKSDDERPQLVVGVDAVAVDEGGGEVEGLVHDVAGELAGVDPLDLPGQLVTTGVRVSRNRSTACSSPASAITRGSLRMDSLPRFARRSARGTAATWRCSPGGLRSRTIRRGRAIDRRARAPGQGGVTGAGQRLDRGEGRRAARRRRPAWSTAPARCSRPTPSDVAAGRGRRRQPPTVVDRLRLDARPHRGDGRRPAAGGRAGRPGRRGARRLGAPQRPAHRARCGCRSASWRSSTRTGPTSPATPPGCASSRATPPSCGARPGAISSNIAIAGGAARGPAPRPACPHDALVLVEDTSREAAVEFMRQRDSIDCLIPRGGPSLIASILDNATVPYVIDGDGNCHVYVDESADLDMARRHRRQRQDPAAVGVQRGRDAARAPRRGADRSCPTLAPTLDGVELVGDERARGPAARRRRRPPTRTGPPSSSTSSWRSGSSTRSTTPSTTSPATARVTARRSSPRDLAAADRFTREVDAAAVLVNASTRFVDGEEFGFGAEIGISHPEAPRPRPDGPPRADHRQVRRPRRRPDPRLTRAADARIGERALGPAPADEATPRASASTRMPVMRRSVRSTSVSWVLQWRRTSLGTSGWGSGSEITSIVGRVGPRPVAGTSMSATKLPTARRTRRGRRRNVRR